MRPTRLLVPLVVLVGFFSRSSGAEEPGKPVAKEKRLFWKVSSEKSEVYLLGSIHVGKADVYPLPQEIEDAFTKCAALAVEADIEKGDPGEIQSLIASKGMYPEGDSIEKHLSNEDLEKLKAGLDKLGLPLDNVRQMKPWLLSLLLQVAALKKLGFDPALGIDQHFLTAARKAKKPILELESVTQQLELISGLEAVLQNASLFQSLSEQDKVKEEVEALFAAWSKGDSAAMLEVSEKQIREHPEFKPFMEKMIDERNVGMTKKIEGYLAEAGPHFVVVGSLHLVGEKGIVALLAAKKFTVEQLPVTPPLLGAAGGRADEAEVKGRRLLVALGCGEAVTLDPRDGKVLERHKTGNDASGAAFSTDGRRAFVTNRRGGTLVELGGASVELGGDAHQPAVAADGRIYVPLPTAGAIAVVRDGKVVRRIEVGAGSKPHVVSLSPDGEWLWATVQGADPRVLAIRLTAEGEEPAREFRHDLVPRVVSAIRGGAWFSAHHSTGLHFASLADGKVTTPWVDRNGEWSEPRKQIQGVAGSADGRLVAVTHEGRRLLVVLEVSGTSLKPVCEAAIDSQNPYWVTLDPSGETAFVSVPFAEAVEAWDIRSSKRLWRSVVGGRAERMAVSEHR